MWSKLSTSTAFLLAFVIAALASACQQTRSAKVNPRNVIQRAIDRIVTLVLESSRTRRCRRVLLIHCRQVTIVVSCVEILSCSSYVAHALNGLFSLFLFQFHLLDVETSRVLLEFFLQVVLLHICLVLFGLLPISLSVDNGQNREHYRKSEEKSCVDVLKQLILSVRKRSCGDKNAETRLAPMVVQETEVALDAFQTELLEGKNDAEKEEVKVHNCIMRRLQLNHGESQSSDRDKQDRAGEVHVLAHLLESAHVVCAAANLGFSTFSLFLIFFAARNGCFIVILVGRQVL